MQGSWRVVAPVKGGDLAKSRLAVPSPGRSALATALALDAVAAAVACPPVAEVLVVSSDPVVIAETGRFGARPVHERRPGAGLLPAVDDGLSAAGSGPVAVLLADVPCLRPEDLAEALRQCGRALRSGAASAFVPDADGVGTVLLAGIGPAALRPAFGPCSARAHERSGSRRLDLDLPRLRRDVDTAAALEEALRLGVGPRTASALRSCQASSA